MPIRLGSSGRIRQKDKGGKTLSDDAQNRDTGVACVPYLRERLRTVFMGNSAVPYRRNRTNKGLGVYI